MWTTDKDGLILGLLAAEMTARLGRIPTGFTRCHERPWLSFYERIDAPASSAKKALLKNLSPEQVSAKELAGEPIEAKLAKSPGNDQPIGGIKVIAKNGWFAARPSGTEDVYKIYAESFQSKDQLKRIQRDALTIVDGILEKTNTKSLEL